MNIMFGDSITDDVKSRYTILQLDTFYFADIEQTRVAYCLIETMPIAEMLGIDKNIELHNNLLRNYALKNWNYCIDAIEHLKGRWNGELDSFYDSVVSRVLQYQATDPGESWNGVIVRD
jgi:hypothetical protein